MLEFFSISRAGFVNGEFFLRNSGSSGFESSINLSMNGVVGESSVENPERIFVKKTVCCCLVFTGREPGGWRVSGGFLVSSWTTSGPRSSRSPSWGPWPRQAPSPRLRDTRRGSRPPRQRRASPGLERMWWARPEDNGWADHLTLQGADVVGPEPGLLCQGDVVCVQIHGHDDETGDWRPLAG